MDRDISRRWNTLSAKELRPGLSAITFLAKGYIYIYVSRSIERVDSIQEIDVRFKQATMSRLSKRGRIEDRVVYDASIGGGWFFSR